MMEESVDWITPTLEIQKNSVDFARQYVQEMGLDVNNLRHQEYRPGISIDEFDPQVYYTVHSGLESNMLSFLVDEGTASVVYQRAIAEDKEQYLERRDLVALVKNMAIHAGFRFVRKNGSLGGFREEQYGVELAMESGEHTVQNSARDLMTIHNVISQYLKE